MVDDSSASIKKIVELGRLDAKLCRIRVEKKELETKFLRMRKALLAEEKRLAAQEQLMREKQSRYQREERGLKDERAKLVERRKSLQTLGNYKLQQAAQREIEHASRQLDSPEEGLLKVLEELEALEQECQKARTNYESGEKQFKEGAQQINESLHALDEREKEAAIGRDKAAQDVSPRLLKGYDRIKDRFGTDPVAAVSADHSCSGCFVKLGPQIVVQLARAEELIKCPGCGRILYLEDSIENSTEE